MVADVDATCSRFRDDSDLSRANRHPGRWVDVDPLLVAAVAVARGAAAESGGLVSPLLGRPLVQLGYDRDLAELPDVTDVPDLPVDVPAPDAWRAIGLDRSGRIRVPDGTALDLGATGKAFAADLVATAVERELGVPAVVSLGGDVRVAAPDGRPWPVAVSEHPVRRPRPPSGSTAAGSPRRPRRYAAGRARASTRHHLLDPRTGRPAPEVWRTVTATGPTCVAANTASTAAVVLGDSAPDWLAAHAVTARLVACRRHGPLPRRLAGRHLSGGS